MNMYMNIKKLAIYNVAVEIPGTNVSNVTFMSRGDITEKRGRAVRAALGFNPGHPFCRVVLKPSYVHRGYLLVSLYPYAFLFFVFIYC